MYLLLAIWYVAVSYGFLFFCLGKLALKDNCCLFQHLKITECLKDFI